MPYNPAKPKQIASSFFNDKSTYVRFYGTDEEDNRTTFKQAMFQAINENCLSTPHMQKSDLFKPFGFDSNNEDPWSPSYHLAACFVLATIEAMFISFPMTIIANSILQILTELILSINSLLKGIFYTMKNEHDTAHSYYLDAASRFALTPASFVNNIIPWGMISLLTRGTATLIDFTATKINQRNNPFVEMGYLRDDEPDDEPDPIGNRLTPLNAC